MIAGVILMILAIGWIFFTLDLAGWDVIATLLHIQTISQRIQLFIQSHPELSILEFAFLGFIVGLSVHFQVVSWHFWPIVGIATPIGALLGVLIWRLRKPGKPV